MVVVEVVFSGISSGGDSIYISSVIKVVAGRRVNVVVKVVKVIMVVDMVVVVAVVVVVVVVVKW